MHQPVRVAPGGTYGEGVASRRAQQVVPLPTAALPAPSPASGPALGAPAGPGAGPTFAPGDMNFEGPTQRPNEPVTAGLPTGPGPGPEVLNLPDQAATTAAYLRTLYANVPQAQNTDFLRLVELAEQQSWV
jgi:hypothetical protein